MIFARDERRGRTVMSEMLEFSSREEFRNWLHVNCLSEDGVWLLFGKAGGPKTVKAGEALEEALCYGWIDGQMQSIDDKTYRKYFSLRRENSKWSEKNKTLAEKLEKQGRMTEYGRKKIEEARKNGQWAAPKAPPITEEQILSVSELLKAYEPAYTNFWRCPHLSGKHIPARISMQRRRQGAKNACHGWLSGSIKI